MFIDVFFSRRRRNTIFKCDWSSDVCSYDLVTAAQQEGEIARGGPPGGRRVGRDSREAPVQVEEEFGQKSVGDLQRADAAQPQFAREPILQGAPEALDAAFGLGRAGLEIADAEIGEHAAEVGGILVALQLLREAPVGVVADENIDPIAIDAQGQAVLGQQLLEDDGVPVQVLGEAEVQGRHGAGGVIDRAQQGHRGAAPLEPIKGTAVDLDELAQARFGRAPLAMLLVAPPVLGGQAQSAPPLADRFATDAAARLLAQLLGGVAVAESRPPCFRRSMTWSAAAWPGPAVAAP